MSIVLAGSEACQLQQWRTVTVILRQSRRMAMKSDQMAMQDPIIAQVRQDARRRQQSPGLLTKPDSDGIHINGVQKVDI